MTQESLLTLQDDTLLLRIVKELVVVSDASVIAVHLSQQGSVKVNYKQLRDALAKAGRHLQIANDCYVVLEQRREERKS